MRCAACGSPLREKAPARTPATRLRDSPQRRGRPMLRANEVRAGLVLRMDPLRLLDHGAEATTDGRGRIWTTHWFICIDRRGDVSDWIATSSKWSPGRAPVRRKWGQVAWVAAPTFADLYQVWTVPSFLGIRAAAAGIDPSGPGLRNFANLDFGTGEAIAA